MGMFSNNKELWNSLGKHTLRLNSVDISLTSLKTEIEVLKGRDTELNARIDNIVIPDIQPIIDPLNDKFNKRCSEIENALMMANSRIEELKNIKPVDVKGIVNPLVKELDDKIEMLDNKVKALNDNRIELLKTIEELKKPKTEPLTEKQQAILDKVKEGMNVKEMAETVGVSVQSIYQTLKILKLKGYDV